MATVEDVANALKGVSRQTGNTEAANAILKEFVSDGRISNLDPFDYDAVIAECKKQTAMGAKHGTSVRAQADARTLDSLAPEIWARRNSAHQAKTADDAEADEPAKPVTDARTLDSLAAGAWARRNGK
jgi:hypothetical protein